MVGFSAQSGCERRRRLAEALREAEVPGEAEDHEWMAGRLHRGLENLDPEDRFPWMEELLLSGLLMGIGMNPADCPRLEGACFPESWLRAVPPMLRSGFPQITWQLIQTGVLTHEGAPWGKTERWRIDGKRLEPLLNEWHELGETLVFRNLARGLAPLSRDHEGRVQIALGNVDRDRGRSWLRQLRNALAPMTPDAAPHLLLA